VEAMPVTTASVTVFILEGKCSRNRRCHWHWLFHKTTCFVDELLRRNASDYSFCNCASLRSAVAIAVIIGIGCSRIRQLASSASSFVDAMPVTTASATAFVLEGKCSRNRRRHRYWLFHKTTCFVDELWRHDTSDDSLCNCISLRRQMQSQSLSSLALVVQEQDN
jgi:hypothetical protein